MSTNRKYLKTSKFIDITCKFYAKNTNLKDFYCIICVGTNISYVEIGTNSLPDSLNLYNINMIVPVNQILSTKPFKYVSSYAQPRIS